MVSVCSEIGSHIRLHRKALGLSQETLALNAGITVSFLGDIERGNKKPTVESLEKLLRALQLSFVEFFSFESAVHQAQSSATMEKLYLLLKGRSDEEVEMICAVVRRVLEYGDARAAKRTP